MKNERQIKVERDWFEKLESYLQADERIRDHNFLHFSLVFYTATKDPKKIIFTCGDLDD